LDTHRAFEYAIKYATKGYSGSTGRGISQAYADIIYRHPLRMRDLARKDWKKSFKKHYDFYQKLTSGLGLELKTIEASRLGKKPQKVGGEATFISRLERMRKELLPFIKPCDQYLTKEWAGNTPFIFEKAQAIGLDKNWAVYPDCTVSDCTFEGIYGSTEGIVNPDDISVKAAVIKATYTSSVGSRVLPSEMKGEMVERIREDAHEYGATTGRPRDIHYLDIPLLSYLMRVGKVEYLVPTHMDIVYPDTPIKVCVGYKKNGKSVDYRPDQEYLTGIEPVFMELPTWDQKAILAAKKPSELPKEAVQFLAFLKKSLNVEILMVTTGPKRNQTVSWF
ncbi:MAG: adenylosuccinate synthetase, partial [Candidatus Pacebacteria bacterium]|nr:adenylosuccinate synthetase [Candidatus Paceibacterota bacterium]